MKQYQKEIDALGRVVIPKEVMEELGFKAKKPVAITLMDDAIIISPNTSVCSLCGKPIDPNSKYHFCSDCLKTIREDGNDIPGRVRTISERKVDELGRIVLPADFRRALNIGETGAITMDANDGVLILTPVVYACAHCGAIIPGGKKYRLCDSCVSKIRRDSGSNIARVLYRAGRFHIGNISFSLPDNTYVSTVTEVEIDNGLGIVSADERVVVIVMANEIAESAKESIDSIFDSETGHKMLGEIEELTVAGCKGYKVMYEDYKSTNIECCLDVGVAPNLQTFTIWAYTDKELGEGAVEDMKVFFEKVAADIKVGE